MNPSSTIAIAQWIPRGGTAIVEVEGAGLHVRVPGKGGLEKNVGPGWDHLGAIRLHATVDVPATVDVFIVESDRRTGFRRRVDLVQGEQNLDVPLRWFHWMDGRVPHWDRVSTLALTFRAATSLNLTSVVLEPGSPFLEAEDLEQVALHPLRKIESPTCRLLWDAPDLNGPGLLGRLDVVAKALQEDLPFLEVPDRPVPIVILANSDEYRTYAVNLARMFNAETPPPANDGYTLQGIAIGAWDPVKGLTRPTYTHEYTHAWLSGVADLPGGTGDWLQEGMASRMQLRFHPQSNIGSVVLQGLKDPRFRSPLAQLLDGRHLPPNRYWQAMTVVDFLLEAHGGKVQELIRRIQGEGSANLLAHLSPVLGMDIAGFETAWMEWTRAKYRGG